MVELKKRTDGEDPQQGRGTHSSVCVGVDPEAEPLCLLARGAECRSEGSR